VRAPDELRELVEAYLGDLALTPELAPLEEPIRHGLGGKRVRPVLALASGADPEPLLPAAAAVELVHSFSLVHDDLPALDNDAERRGKPTVWAAYGEATAILAGDALLTLAFDWIAEAGEHAGRPRQFLAASRALARGAGAFGMVRGQARDLGEPPPTTMDALETLHAEKTAALFRAALEVGGCAAGAEPDTLGALARYGTAYGIAFQHADDAADREHADHAQAAAARLQALVTEACAALAPLGGRAGRLVELAHALARQPQ
jgi:geranylgeranyl pyrophosphate synthase